ncbi:MAG: carbohydrate-binding protein [Candidatus Sumerlaea chitinivorans]|nr:carbohydrate-binding protein [Candidatus Sumerlaea chitinivorans]
MNRVKRALRQSARVNLSLLGAVLLGACLMVPAAGGSAPVQTSYLWHLHQPIYWPAQRPGSPEHYEVAWDTIQQQNGGRTHPSETLSSIFGLDDRIAAYQFRPRDSVQTVLGLPNAGAQLTYSGSLIENVNSLSGNLSGYYSGWQNSFIQARQWTTSGGKPRLDMVNFTHHHSLAPLQTTRTVQMELLLHQHMMAQRFGTNPPLSKGFFPTEMAFSERLIPVLKSVGIDWAVVSGNHLSRVCADFPLVLGSGGENTQPPNLADVLNPAQGYYYRVSIDRGCSPCNAAPFAYTPHRAQYVDPYTGAVQTLVVVPSAMEFSWFDGYRNLGANELAPIASQNNPSRPMLVLMAHDGDNAYGGGYSYYMESVQNFCYGAAALGYNPTTVEQYLSQFPVPADDIVKVEDGAWVNADGDFGSPTFINWNYPLLNAAGQPDPVNGWHEKPREYAVYLAAENRIRTAEKVLGVTPRIAEVANPSSGANAVEKAWHFFLAALDSGFLYYGTYGDVEVRGTIACNKAVEFVDSVLTGNFPDTVGPTIWIPQRWPYNPGSVNFGVETGYTQKILGPDFTIWTFVYDVSGLSSVTLKWRVDNDGINPLTSTQNETYAGGPEVGAWQSLPMNGRAFPKGNVYNKPDINYYVLPTYIADHFSATISGQTNKLIDYYVEAVDAKGNVERTPIQHVWVGNLSGGGGGGSSNRVTLTPSTPTAGQPVGIAYDPVGGPLQGAPAVNLHWGINNWATVYTDVAMSWNASAQRWMTTVTLPLTATQLDMVFNNGAGTWDNNSGQDWHFPVQGAPAPMWTIDGNPESESLVRANTPGGLKLWVARDGNLLYVGTQGAGNGRDHFIFITRNLTNVRSAPWGKAGTCVAWDAYLANENDNNWSGWFDANESQTLGGFTLQASGGSGGVLEGQIDLSQLYPSGGGGLVATADVPSVIYIAAGEYGTANGGTLFSSTQVPSTSNGDGNLDAGEFFAFTLSAVEDWSLY